MKDLIIGDTVRIIETASDNEKHIGRGFISDTQNHKFLVVCENHRDAYICNTVCDFVQSCRIVLLEFDAHMEAFTFYQLTIPAEETIYVKLGLQKV